jgi:hypothetical protein
VYNPLNSASQDTDHQQQVAVRVSSERAVTTNSKPLPSFKDLKIYIQSLS